MVTLQDFTPRPTKKNRQANKQTVSRQRTQRNLYLHRQTLGFHPRPQKVERPEKVPKFEWSNWHYPNVKTSLVLGH